MFKRWLPGLLAIILGGMILIAGYWKFPARPFSVPVKLTTGESALVSGSLPTSAWLGGDTAIEMTFQFTSPVTAGPARLRAEVVMPGTTLSPNGPLTLIVNPAEAVHLAWKVKPNRMGDIEGTLWLNSVVGSGELQAVLARRFQIHSIALFGISADWLRRIGLVFLAIGAFLAAAFARKSARSRK